MTHDHVTATGRHRRRLAVVLALTLAIAALQVVGGLVSGSLALLADAGHMVTDAAGVAIALGAATVATRPPTPRRTFGLLRAEVLAALTNGLLLVVLAVWVVVEAVRRWAAPPEVTGGVMLAVAVVGLAANLVSLRLLHGGRHESLNVRGAYLEVLGDLLGSVAVVVSGVVVATTGWVRADAVASVAGLCHITRFEGQAAMETEFVIGDLETDASYPFSVEDGAACRAGHGGAPPPALDGLVVDWAPMMQAVVEDIETGVPPAMVSVRFHNTLAEIIVTVAGRMGEARVALTGGCFQNKYLLERSVHRLEESGFKPYWHQRIPPNDGCIAPGQVVAVSRLLS